MYHIYIIIRYQNGMFLSLGMSWLTWFAARGEERAGFMAPIFIGRPGPLQAFRIFSGIYSGCPIILARSDEIINKNLFYIEYLSYMYSFSQKTPVFQN